jgi:hypothetical protein
MIEMPLDISIGIVTYLGRYETYFMPLIRKLYRVFPDYQIIVFINGHHDQVKQVCYLQKITSFLGKFKNVSYVTHFQHQPLARSWNWLIFLSNSEKTLLINDDVILTYEFRYHFERLTNLPDIFLINKSWSHFVISKKIIRDAGWFDERFVGMGYEDHDYTFRLAMRGITIQNFTFPGIWDQNAPQTDAGWATFSEIDRDEKRHSQINQDFFKKKWYWSNYDHVPETGSITFFDPMFQRDWTVAPKVGIDEVPNYYPLRCPIIPPAHSVDIRQNILKFLSRVISVLSSRYWKLRRTLRIRSRFPKLFGQ